jgi:hypothetical protein
VGKREKLKEWVRGQTDDELHKVFLRGNLGNVAQGLGLSGKGSFRELLMAIRREAVK